MSTWNTVSNEELPLWMRRSLRGKNWGLLLAFLFSIGVAWPFIYQPGLPRNNASENYVFRTADYAAAFREGNLYPRWSPHAITGYGAPIAHYYPPGAPYLAALIQTLFTDDAVVAVRIVYIAALVTASIATYHLVARRSNASIGLLASILYVYSPMIGLTIPHLLGDLPAAMALALMPAFFWSLDRIITGSPPLGMSITAIITFLLVVTHPQIAVVSIIMAVGFLICYLRETEKHDLLSAIIAIILGGGLATFYWLPVVVEYQAVEWRQINTTTGRHLHLSDLFTPVQQVDAAAIVPSPQFTLGLWITLLTAVSIIFLLISRRTNKFGIYFLATGIAMLVLGLAAFPKQVWLLGPVTLCLTVAASKLLSFRRWWLPETYRRLMIPILLIAILMNSSSVWLARQWNPNFGNTTPQDQIRYEQLGYGIAVLPPTFLLPTTLAATLSPNRFLLEGYQLGIVNRLPRNQLTANIRADLLSTQADISRYQIQATQPTTLNILAAFFPGWEATLSNESLPIRPDDHTGLIQIDIPATNSSELEIKFGTTPIRTTSWVVSAISLLLLLVISYESIKRQSDYLDEYELMTNAEARLLGVLWLSFALIVVIFSGRDSSVSLRNAPGTMLRNSTPFEILTNTPLSTTAYRFDKTDFQFGDTLEFTIYWRTLRQPGINYQVQTHLMNLADNTQHAQSDFRHPGHYPTSRWQPNGFIADEYTIPITRQLTPGDYQIAVTVAECTRICEPESPRLTFFETDGSPIGQTLLLPIPISINE